MKKVYGIPISLEKTVRQLVEEGMDTEVDRLGDESRIKLQETIQKVVNDGNGGLVCIII